MQGRNPAAGLGHKAAAGQSQAPPPGNAPPPPNGQSARPGLWARIPKPLRRAAFFILPSLWFWDNVACIGVVQGRSMQPTLNPDSNMLSNDIVILDKWSIRRNKYHVGDVVLAIAPHDRSLLLFKRLIALPFDLVRPRDYRKKHDPSEPPENQFLSDKVIEIPPGRCWLESDEPFHGTDSNAFGPVPLGLIKARVAYVIWPRFMKVERGEWEAKSKVAMWEEQGPRRISYRSGGVWVDRGDD